MDEQDLDTKYAKKPARLEAIKKNTRTYWCDVGEVTLFEDMEYETNTLHSVGSKREREAEVELKETKLKKPKKPKVETEVAAVGGSDAGGEEKGNGKPLPPEKKMTEKQVTTLQSAMEKLEGLFDKFTEAIKDLSQQPQPKWYPHVPGYVHTLIQKVTMENNLLKSEVAATITADNATTEFGKATKEKITNLKASIKDVQRRASIQIEEAQSIEDDE